MRTCVSLALSLSLPSPSQQADGNRGWNSRSMLTKDPIFSECESFSALFQATKKNQRKVTHQGESNRLVECITLASLHMTSLDAHNLMLVCSTWRSALLAHTAAWEEYTRRKFPNLRALPPDATPAGRDGYLRRMLLLHNFDRPVRPFVLPRFLLPASLAALQPDSITFLVDVTFQRVRLLSLAHRCALNHRGEVVADTTSKKKQQKDHLGSVEVVLEDTQAFQAVAKLPCAAAHLLQP